MDIDKLIKKCVKGNARAQKQYFLLYVDRLYSTSLRYLNNKEDAEDILYQSFTKIFQKLESLQFINERALVGWMKKIVINEALMYLRKNSQRVYKVERIDDVVEETDFLADNYSDEELMEIVRNLPEGYRNVFCMYVVDGYSHKEIAATLGINENTSRSQFFKARKLLREQLKKSYDRSVGA